MIQQLKTLVLIGMLIQPVLGMGMETESSKYKYYQCGIKDDSGKPCEYVATLARCQNHQFIHTTQRGEYRCPACPNEGSRSAVRWHIKYSKHPDAVEKKVLLLQDTLEILSKNKPIYLGSNQDVYLQSVEQQRLLRKRKAEELKAAAAYICNIQCEDGRPCSFSSTSKWNVFNHRYKHLTQKQLTCISCGKQITKQAAKNHIKSKMFHPNGGACFAKTQLSAQNLALLHLPIERCAISTSTHDDDESDQEISFGPAPIDPIFADLDPLDPDLELMME